MTPKETIIDQSRKLFIVLSDYVDKMPRNLKFTVGDRIITNNLDLMECLIEAYYGKKNERLEKINKANVKLEIIRQIMRYLFETNRHNLKKHEHLNKELDTIGMNLGGWRKQLLGNNS